MKKNNVTIREVYELIKDLSDDIKDNYVTKSEFFPVRAIAFGMVAIVLMAVFTAVLANVIRANL